MSFTTWEQMSRKEQLASEYYDFYKEVHGIRPRFMDFNSMSEQDLEATLAALTEQATYVFAKEEEREQQCITQFEARVVKVIESGAKDRETAIRWMMDAQCDDDVDSCCYAWGLPYNYFKIKQHG